MKWSVKIGKFVGIDVYMHLTFLLLIGWVALVHWQRGPKCRRRDGWRSVHSRHLPVRGAA